MSEREQLEQVIAALEAQRTTLGDAVVDAALGSIRRQLIELQAAERGPASAFEGERRLVTVDGEERSLTAKEFDLLWAMARHPRQVFSRDQLLDLVWGLTEYIDPSTVTVHVRRLRAKIEVDPGEPRYIVTVWGVGYRFEP